MKNYLLFALIALLSTCNAEAAERRLPKQAGPALEEEVKERDAARQAQAEPTPEQALALWLYQQRQALRDEEHDIAQDSRLSGLGQGGALQNLRQVILSHFQQPIPVFPGIARKLSFNTTKGNSFDKNRVSISPDGRVVAFASPYFDQGTNTIGTNIRIYAIEVLDGEPKLVLTDSLPIAYPYIPLSTAHLAFAPYGTYLAVSITTRAGPEEDQNTTMLYTLNDKSKRLVKHFEADHLLFSPNGSALVIANAQRILIYDSDNLEEKPILLETPKPIELLTFSLDGAELTAKMVNEKLKSWDTQNWKEVIRKKGQKQAASAFIPYFSPGFIIAHASSPDGAYAAVSLSSGTILLFDRNKENGEDHLALQNGSADIVQLGFWPDAPYLTAVSADGAVTIWNIKAMEHRRTMANRLLKFFLSRLTNRKERIAVRTLITASHVHLIPLLKSLAENKLPQAQSFLQSVQAGLQKPPFKLSLKKDDFTLKDLDSEDIQTQLMQNVIANEYAFLDR